MAVPKHRADASERIDDLVYSLPEWSKKICIRLRKLLQQSDPEMIEDWKWGPNYYCKGMVCGFAPFKKHVTLVFFKGTQLSDNRKILEGDPNNLNIRSMKFTSESEVNEDFILEYILEAIDLNRNGTKVVRAAEKQVIIPDKLKKVLKKSGVLLYFENLSYSQRKEYVRYIEDAKREETKQRRLDKVITIMCGKAGIVTSEKKNKV